MSNVPNNENVNLRPEWGRPSTHPSWSVLERDAAAKAKSEQLLRESLSMLSLMAPKRKIEVPEEPVVVDHDP